MAHATFNNTVDDSDSEYDPSRIPANPPKTMHARSLSTSSKSDTQSASNAATSPSVGIPSDAIIHEAERDRAAIDNVYHRPMFAQTEEVKRALDLCRKWNEGADARYGPATMDYLRVKVLGPAMQSKMTELQRILSVREQTNGEHRSKDSHTSPMTTQSPTILPPIKPRSDMETLSPTTVRPLQNGFHSNGTYANGSQTNGSHHGNVNGTHSNGINSRPSTFSAASERRPLPPRAPSLTIPQSHLPSPLPSLPPMQSESSRPNNNPHQPSPIQSSQPPYPQPANPVSRGRNWIYTTESDLWCPICRVGPLSCMHSHRMIGQLFVRGIKYSSVEELQYTYEQLENWAYRGHPLQMEPAMTKSFSLEELAAEQKSWIDELRVILSQAYSRGRGASVPRITSTQPQAHFRDNSTPVRTFPDSRFEDPRYANQSPMTGPNSYAGTPTSYNNPTPTSIRSPAVSYPNPPRVHDQGICRICPRNTACVHQRDDRRPSYTPSDLSNVEHKRKRSVASTSTRRVKPGFRSELGDISTSDDDDADEAEPTGQPCNAKSYQKFNQVREIVDNMPKDQLSTAILRMCYSNTMILNWMKKELKKSGMPKEIVVTGEGALITPTSPDSTTAKATESNITNHVNSATRSTERITRCTKCDFTFDTSREPKDGECQFHDGDLIADRRLSATSRIWQQDEVVKQIWTCCAATKSAKGCKSGKHSNAAPRSNAGPDRPTVNSLMGVAAGRLPVRHYSQKFSVEQGALHPGQSLVKALAEAEKETERYGMDNYTLSPISRRSSAGAVNDYNTMKDYSPPLNTLDELPSSSFDLDITGHDQLDLSADPERNLLHKHELSIASQLQITCAVYLCEKRRLFRALVEAMQEGTEFGQSEARAACQLSPEKTRAIFTVFEKIGWLEPKHFMRYLNDPSGNMIRSIERTLPGVNSLPYSGTNSSGRPNSAPDLAQSPVKARRASSGSASAPIGFANQIDRVRKQRSPNHLPQVPSLFQPLYNGHIHTQRYHGASGHHMDHGHNTVNLTDLSRTPPRDLIMAGSPETYQWRKNGNGKKMQVPICPYPRSWAEADSVDRELVRLKRHEGKQWEELFEWWRGKGRASLKNASCLAVRYSILKKNYESDWAREGL